MKIALFHFKNDTEHYTFVDPFIPNIIIHIQRIGNSLASLYFTNAKNERIDIPEDTFISCNDFQTRKPIIQKPFQQEYILSWIENYSVYLHGECVLTIKTEQYWSIEKEI